jgi:hypothetical protein
MSVVTFLTIRTLPEPAVFTVLNSIEEILAYLEGRKKVERFK